MTFLIFKSPGWMVIVGGLSTAVILLIVVVAAIFFRYRRLDRHLRPGMIYDIALWLSALAITFVVLVGLKDAWSNAAAYFAPAAISWFV